MTEVVAVDIGGTHARFALARLEGGRVAALGDEITLATADHAGLDAAWREYGVRLGRRLPAAAAIALAGPVEGEVLRLTNHDWTIRPAALPSGLGVERLTLVNDFGAVAHAVARLGDEHFTRLCGPDSPLPVDGAISIVGPGTGLGVALLLRRAGRDEVIETEGGHIGFAPADALEDRLLAGLRERCGGRVSAERIVSGPGLRNLWQALGGGAGPYPDDKTLWRAAMAGEDARAATALDLFCRALGAVAGDLALAHGAAASVIAGGVGLRLAPRLPASRFREGFTAKGRFSPLMEGLPVRILTHPQPGLFGAAAAFAAEHRQ